MPNSDIESQIRAYIEAAKKSNLTRQKIYDEFVQRNYPTYVVDYYLTKYFDKKAHRAQGIMLGLIVISIILISLYVFSNPSTTETTESSDVVEISQSAGPYEEANCNNKECFTLKADNCEKAEFERLEDGSTFNYQTDNCQFIKTASKINPSEPDNIKQLLEGKSLTCQYVKGQFEVDWINTLTLKLDKCQGPLKDGLQTLLQF